MRLHGLGKRLHIPLGWVMQPAIVASRGAQAATGRRRCQGPSRWGSPVRWPMRSPCKYGCTPAGFSPGQRYLYKRAGLQDSTNSKAVSGGGRGAGMPGSDAKVVQSRPPWRRAPGHSRGSGGQGHGRRRHALPSVVARRLIAQNTPVCMLNASYPPARLSCCRKQQAERPAALRWAKLYRRQV